MTNKYTYTVSLLLLFLCSNPLYSNEKDYLSEIEAETSKVDVAIEAQGETAGAGQATTGETGLKAEFETRLKEKYRGSYVFYTKLPERSRQEMLQEYQNGAPIRKIRRKIINRYMQR